MAGGATDTAEAAHRGQAAKAFHRRHHALLLYRLALARQIVSSGITQGSWWVKRFWAVRTEDRKLLKYLYLLE